MSRMLPSASLSPCGICGNEPAFDFLGDVLCLDCAYDGQVAAEPEYTGGDLVLLDE